MNILFNIAKVNRSFGGVFQYASALLNICGELKNHTFYVYHQVEDEFILSIINKHDNLILVNEKEPIFYKGIRICQLFLDLICSKIFNNKTVKKRSYFKNILKKYKIDIIHTPYQQLLKDESINCPSISTLHDVQELHYPEYFSPEERAKRAINNHYITKSSDYIIVSYEHIRQDIIKYFQKDPELIGVVLLNMSKLWFEKFQVENVLANVKNIDLKSEKYLFYPAATWEHKNHLGLIKAIKYLKDSKNEKIKVLFTGHQTDYYQILKAKIIELDVEDQIHFLGIINELELYSLYQNATLVVVPTIYEAGSFPLMESILMRIPVICSNITSLPETIDNKEYTFDPHNSTDLGNLIYKLLKDPEQLKKNIQNSKRVSDRLINNNSIQLIDNIYSRLYNKRIKK